MSFDQLFDISEIEDSYIFKWSEFTPLLEEFRISLSEFRQLIVDLELNKNISAKKNAYHHGALTLDSGLTLPFNPETLALDDLEVIEFYEDGSNTIVEIAGLPLSDEQRLVLEQMQSIKIWITLPYDVFFDLIINQQGVRGKNLISLCVANPKLNAKCNYVRDDGESIFTRLLKQDFDLEVEAGEARKRYLEQYRGKIWTFGEGRFGQLGYKSTKESYPRQIEGFNVRSVSCAEHHTAMILADGTIWTFGNGFEGRLGHGNEADVLRPRRIKQFNNVRSVSCGNMHTAMILADGTIWTFGDSRYGKLGHGNVDNVRRPRQIIRENGKPFTNVRSVSCGGEHTAMILSNGTIWTFGKGVDGCLGHGNQAHQERPKQIVGENGKSFSNVQSVSCGGYHTAMILSDGTIWTFGIVGSGQLGHGGDQDELRPRQIEGFFNVLTVSCGVSHTTMILSNGTIWTFGAGMYGRLGHGVERNEPRPRQIKGFNNVRSVSARGYTAMILADGTIWTFGYGGWGLGHDGTQNELIPRQIKGFNNVRSVSCGILHTAMITN